MSTRFIAVFLGLFLLSACVREAPNLAIVPADDLYSQGMAEYNDGRYGKAIPFFEAFVENHLGDPRAPETRLLLGRAYMERGEELTAIMHYQRLVNDFPSSGLQVDARFGICDAYHELSPQTPLDQEYTRSALLHCASIVQYFPGTEQADTANTWVGELRHKLAKKLYDTGVYYHQRRVYDAAVVYLEDAVTQYPQTTIAPMALAKLIEVYGVMGYVEDAEEARRRLVTNYPESAEARALGAVGENS